MNDEQQIRALMQTWMDATKSGDIQTVLGLMTDDVVFMVVGQEPFGKDAFRKASEAMASSATSVRFEGESKIEELQVLGDWAYARSRLKVTAVPADGAPIQRAGFTLTIFRREEDGKWRLSRDANMLKIVS